MKAESIVDARIHTPMWENAHGAKIFNDLENYLIWGCWILDSCSDLTQGDLEWVTLSRKSLWHVCELRANTLCFGIDIAGSSKNNFKIYKQKKKLENMKEANSKLKMIMLFQRLAILDMTTIYVQNMDECRRLLLHPNIFNFPS